MKVVVHSLARPTSRRELDTCPLCFSVAQSRFHMELGAPYVIYADPKYTPEYFEFAQNGIHAYFAEESIASGFYEWLKKADQDAKERFCNMPD